MDTVCCYIHYHYKVKARCGQSVPVSYRLAICFTFKVLGLYNTPFLYNQAHANSVG